MPLPAAPTSTNITALYTNPSTMAVLGNQIYVVDSGSAAIYVLNSSLTYLHDFTLQTAILSSPDCISADGTNIWVSDGGDNTLYKFGPTGNTIFTINTLNGKTIQPYSFYYYSGNLYVVDPPNDRICVINNTTGAWIQDIALPASSGATGIYVNASKIYIGLWTTGNVNVSVYTTAGSFVTSFTNSNWNVAPVLVGPDTIVIDSLNQIWVSDTNHGNVYLYDSNYQLLTTYANLFLGGGSRGGFAFFQNNILLLDTNADANETIIWTWSNVLPQPVVLPKPLDRGLEPNFSTLTNNSLPGTTNVGLSVIGSYSRTTKADNLLDDVNSRYQL